MSALPPKADMLRFCPEGGRRSEDDPEDALLRLDVSRPDHLGPLLGFGHD
jgi:hypothetical protein